MTDLAVRRETAANESDLALAVRTVGLTRRFGSYTAVDTLDLEVPRGAVYGFLGPNGSGKTTTIRMLLGLMRPHAGTVEVLGRTIPEDAGQVLTRVGALVEGPAFHLYLSGRQNLRRLDAFDPSTDPATSRDRIDAALERVGLSAAADKRFRTYSLGMKQRLGLAATLLRPRDLLVLDEPTNGLDPQGTREVRALVREVARDGVTVLVSSHLLSEIEQVATHVGIMSGGRLIRQGALRDVLAGTRARLRVETTCPAAATAMLRSMGLSITESGPGWVRTALNGTRPETVNALLVQAGVPVSGLGVETPALEELFVSLTGEGFDVVG